MVAERFDRALRVAGIPIVGVSIGVDADRSTWRIQYDASATAQHRVDGEALRVTFDPFAQSVLDAEVTDRAAVASVDKDRLASYALIAKTVDPAGWAALTVAGKVAKVQGLAADWRGFRAFVEKNL